MQTFAHANLLIIVLARTTNKINMINVSQVGNIRKKRKFSI